MSARTHPHQRRNLLTGDWVLVSPHRAERPWQGDVAAPAAPRPPWHDVQCHLCPGNLRANGLRNPEYDTTFVFPNDFPALLEESGGVESTAPFEVRNASGEARVICFSPDHGASLADMGEAALGAVIDCWCSQSEELGRSHGHVQIFENKGAMMGCSSPHPHGQVWASDFIPSEVDREDRRQREWKGSHDSVLLDTVALAELEAGERVIEANEHWLVVVPHWASWPFETLVMPRRPVARIEQLDRQSRNALASSLARLLARYDALFGVSFPYSMGWHGAPHALGDDVDHWRLHAHFYPPLLRSATVRKYMVGFEMLAQAQRDFTPEAAAARLRSAL